MARRWWCRRKAEAKRVTAAAMARLKRRGSQDVAAAAAVGIGDAVAAVLAAARRLNIMLYSDDEVAREAERIIVRIDDAIDALKRSGEMKSINRSYKSYRIEAAARGDKVLPYAQWLNKYRQKLMREFTAALRDC